MAHVGGAIFPWALPSACPLATHSVCTHEHVQSWPSPADFPDSRPAIEDLKYCLQRTDQRQQLLVSLKAALETRLLHPGASGCCPQVQAPSLGRRQGKSCFCSLWGWWGSPPSLKSFTLFEGHHGS